MTELVIDADVFRSSGMSEHPHSKNARLVLEAVRHAKQLLVQTPALKVEHDKHQSRFARTWRASMIARKLWVKKDAPEDSALRDHLVAAQNPESDNDARAVLKDAHLLEAAKVADLRIISKDTTAKLLFQKGCPLPHPYGHIQWADATNHSEETVDWIESGCPQRRDWSLCQ